MNKDQVYWVGQKAFIEKDGKLLVLKSPHGIDFPGGKIQEGEKDIITSLQREVSEETGLEVSVKNPFFVWQNIFSEGHKYFGHRVYLVGFKAEYVSGNMVISDEHVGYQWVDEDTYQSLDDGSDYYKAIKEYFKSK